VTTRTGWIVHPSSVHRTVHSSQNCMENSNLPIQLCYIIKTKDAAQRQQHPQSLSLLPWECKMKSMNAWEYCKDCIGLGVHNSANFFHLEPILTKQAMIPQKRPEGHGLEKRFRSQYLWWHPNLMIESMWVPRPGHVCCHEALIDNYDTSTKSKEKGL
jgi:hypothetical protein